MLPAVETCQENLVTLSLTDTENANMIVENTGAVVLDTSLEEEYKESAPASLESRKAKAVESPRQENNEEYEASTRTPAGSSSSSASDEDSSAEQIFSSPSEVESGPCKGREDAGTLEEGNADTTADTDSSSSSSSSSSSDESSDAGTWMQPDDRSCSPTS